MEFFQITGSHDYEDGNAKGLVGAPVIRIGTRKTRGKYIAGTVETPVTTYVLQKVTLKILNKSRDHFTTCCCYFTICLRPNSTLIASTYHL